MVLFILSETAAGYALFKATDRKILKRDNLADEMADAMNACSLLRLKNFRKFESADAALEQAVAVGEGKVTPMLSNLLKDIKAERKASLAVADPKLANAISNVPGLQIKPIADPASAELYRAIRLHLGSLIPGLLDKELDTMSLGLSHSLSRHKLKFTPDKIDIMVIQAIALLDDLDKELNMYAMRTKEWYGWHFPELARLINENLAYARVVLAMGMRSNAAQADLTEILPEEMADAVKAAAEVSMGTEITDEDWTNIKCLAEQVVGFTQYRKELLEYLQSRMRAISPNATALVGELVAARLIAHAGSLTNLAKSPASTIQILGAEKALFRALKTKHHTPKYGIIYNAALVGAASGKNKGKLARMLAAKSALALRIDALSDWGQAGEGERPEPSEEDKATMGISARADLERKLRAIEGRPVKPSTVAIAPQQQQQQQPGKWNIEEARKYNKDADGLDSDAEPDPDAIQEKLTEELRAGKEKLEAMVSRKRKLIEVVDETKDGASDGENDEESADEAPANGVKDVKEESKAEKKARKEEKKRLKAEKAARKAERAAKRAAKEARKAAKATEDGEPKKKKKKSSQ
ncbi:Nop domain-containing protein [Piedraia hortae CBS 480.64]|uniref:Nucleolar protein 58 n=1 Tax=Piedraia hortae CBS 480.64 TaxID=1314780 RepID=A0A6A7C9U1_9PEZI|nr:Nop domain-containing protein [Piedraia hortae CBS 480.64]